MGASLGGARMGLHIRVMMQGDIAPGMRLKNLAGWNQTPEDWVRFLQANPHGCFVAEYEGQVAGTVATIIYEGRLAWIGMVLVDPQFRGKGIGTALLATAVRYLDGQRIACIKLDATPLGKPLYERMGFKTEYEIERRVLKRTSIVAPPAACQIEDPGPILAADRDFFGADRSALLRSIIAAAPELLVSERQNAKLNGYALGRKGSHADHLGPWIASDASAARGTLQSFLARSRRGLVYADLLTDNAWARALADERGFELSRALTRMYRGENRHPGRPDQVCAILGPEFG